MPNILFIQGWFTYTGFNYGGSHEIYYKDFINYLSSKGFLTTFEYNDNEKVSSVYDRLKTLVNNNKFSHIIGHSMGGSFLMLLLRDKVDLKSAKLIFSEPYIYPSIDPVICEMVQKIPFYKHIKVNTVLIVPSFFLHSNFTLRENINNLSKNVFIHQYADITVELPDIIPTLDKYDGNISIIYSIYEKLSEIPCNELVKLTDWDNGTSKKLIFIPARHMPTWDNKDTKSMYYNIFDKPFRFFKIFIQA
jgi:hypothetical protein